MSDCIPTMERKKLYRPRQVAICMGLKNVQLINLFL